MIVAFARFQYGSDSMKREASTGCGRASSLLRSRRSSRAGLSSPWRRSPAVTSPVYFDDPEGLVRRRVHGSVRSSSACPDGAVYVVFSAAAAISCGAPCREQVGFLAATASKLMVG
jgi:hypothetical protein